MYLERLSFAFRISKNPSLIFKDGDDSLLIVKPINRVEIDPRSIRAGSDLLADPGVSMSESDVTDEHAGTVGLRRAKHIKKNKQGKHLFS